MSWIPHLMVLDDDPRVLDSLVPSVVHQVARGIDRNRPVAEALRRGTGSTGGAIQVKVSAHGYDSERVGTYRHRSPHHVHLHLVRERAGRFDAARRLLSDQLFAVVVSDLRFSDDAGGQRAGQFFVDEVERVHPEVQGLLYSAYPKPEGFPAARFVRKGGEASGETALADVIVESLARYLADPHVAAFVEAIADQGLVYQSDAFGTTLAHVFGLARLVGNASTAAPSVGRARRPLPCVLLDGESGTGKRGLAALFHAGSDRRKAPLAVASCNELTNETLLRSILFGHKKGAFTDAREDRPGLVTSAGKGVLLLDDFHRLPTACSAILHSFLEDGEYSRLGEEEIRRRADCAVVLTVETGPWAERRRSGELPLAFLARVERLPLEIPPLRERPEDIKAQARWLAQVVSAEVGSDLELAEEAIERLTLQLFSESNSRELRNVIERAVFRHHREVDVLEWSHLEPFLNPTDPPANAGSVRGSSRRVAASSAPAAAGPKPALNDWQRRLRALAEKILAREDGFDGRQAGRTVEALFESALPAIWQSVEDARTATPDSPPVPLPTWESLWRCFAVYWLGGPSPAEKVLGIPANTLRQWINDRESR